MLNQIVGLIITRLSTALVGCDGSTLGTDYYDTFGNITEQSGNFNKSNTYTGYQYDKDTKNYGIITKGGNGVKKLYIALIFILSIIAVQFLIIQFPIKKSVRINLKTINQEALKKSDKVLICKLSTDTGPQWEVIGKNNGLFNLVSQTQNIIVKGNIPKRLNGDLYDNMSTNIFVFEGKIIGEEADPYGGKYYTFKVDKWNIIYPINRGKGFVELMPKNALTVYDFLPLP